MATTRQELVEVAPRASPSEQGNGPTSCGGGSGTGELVVDWRWAEVDRGWSGVGGRHTGKTNKMPLYFVVYALETTALHLKERHHDPL